LAVGDDELERVEHGARIAGAVPVEHLEADDARLRRQPPIERALDTARLTALDDVDLAFGGFAGTRDQRRHVSAVSVVVVGMAALAVGCEVEELVAARAREVLALLEARIDDGDADLLAF